MQQRIDRLKADIVQLRHTATTCDADIRRKLLALADEMQAAVDEMQERLTAAASDGPAAPSLVHRPPSSASDESARAARHAKRGKLLLVEDEALLRALLADYLREEGLDVVLAAHCEAAITRFEEDPDIDCVLSDVRMPDGNGFDLAQRLLARRPAAKIALISGFSERMPDDLKQKGVRLFKKPIPLADVAMHVKQLWST